MKALLRRTGVSTLAHHVWRRPTQALRKLIAEGGPVAVYRTSRGRQEMEAAATTLPALPAFPSAAPLEVHLLTGRAFWFQTAFCLWTLARQAARPIRPILYDDGTLDVECRDHLARLFPDASHVSPTECVENLETHFPAARFPALRDRWRVYPHIRKLIDPHAGGHGWKLVMDSDLLFFRPPTALIAWRDRPDRPLHAVDCTSSYGYSRSLMSQLAGTPIDERINVGLTGLESTHLDWDRIESWCRTLLAREGPNYYLEQALIAMLVSHVPCAVMPADDYVTRPEPPEALDCRAVMHHYVAESRRWYYQANWRRVLSAPAPSPTA
ncbi:MAG TPA: glycosyl transferase family 2 [Candidatus Didemnitutus sp.]|nr:glycosyl transferase family 2 [Candidatus Didemnitutus sp.]